MTKRIIDVLEIVEIDEQHSQLLLPRDPAQRLLKLRPEKHAVGQIGQGIMMRHMRDLRFGASVLGHILMGDHPPATRHWLSDEMDDPVIGGCEMLRSGLTAFCQIENAFAVFPDIAGKETRHLSVFHQSRQRASRLHHILRKAIYFEVAIIAHDDPSVRIEHEYAVCHVVEGFPQQQIVVVKFGIGSRWRDNWRFSASNCRQRPGIFGIIGQGFIMMSLCKHESTPQS